MLKRIGIAIAVIVVIIVVAAAVAPYWVGGAAEANFKAQVARLNTRLAARGLSLHVDSYHRGFYSSGADISLTAAPGRMNEHRAKIWAILFGASGVPVFHLHINHGPVPFDAFGYGHWNFMPVLYTAVFQGKNLPALSLVGALKANVYVVQYFTGSTHARLMVPPGRISLGVAGAKWQGGHLAVDLNAAQDKAHYTGLLKPITFQFMNPKSGVNYSGKFAGLHFSGSPRKAKHGFWIGPQKYVFDDLTVRKGDTQIVKLAAGRINGKTSETDNGRWLNVSAHGNLDSGTIRGWKFSKFTLSYAAAQVDASGFRQVIDKSHDQAANTQPSGKGAMQGFGLMLSMFELAFKPETTASLRMHLAAPSGTASVAAHVDFSKPAVAGTKPMPALLQKMPETLKNMKGYINVRFNRKLAEDFGMKVLGVATPQSVNRALQAMTKIGYIAQGPNGNYHAHARLSFLSDLIALYDSLLGMRALAAQTAPHPVTASNAQSTPAPATGR